MEEDRLQNLPKSWTSIKLSEVIDIIPLTGKKLKHSEYLEEGKVPVIDQGQSFIGGYTDKVQMKINCPSPVIVFGDHTKVIKYVNFDFIAGADGIKVIKPEELFIPKLFFYFLQAVPLPDRGYSRHFQFLEKSLIPIPPLPEQHRIIAKIEELFSDLDAGVEALKKAKAQLKLYRQAVLKAAFEGRLTAAWREANERELEPANVLLERIHKHLKETGISKGKGFLPIDKSHFPELPERWTWARLGDISIINPRFKSEGIPDDTEVSFLPMSAVQELTGKTDLSMTKKVSEVKKGYTSFINGDLLFAKITPCMENGKVAIANNLLNCLGFGSTEFHVIRFYQPFITKFFFFFLIQESLREDARRNMKGTAGQLRVPPSYMEQITIPLPPISEQGKIIEEIDRYFSLADAVDKALDNGLNQSGRLRQSILKQAFSGRLVPQDPEDEPAAELLERIKGEKAGHIAGKKSGRKAAQKDLNYG